MKELQISVEGVTKLLQKVNPNKASGPDSIPARILKELADEIAPLLTIIFNKSLEQGEVPTDWRKANVTAIYKKGNKYEPSNYRPVSLTSLCCKLQEHILSATSCLTLKNMLSLRTASMDFVPVEAVRHNLSDSTMT